MNHRAATSGCAILSALFAASTASTTARENQTVQPATARADFIQGRIERFDRIGRYYQKQEPVADRIRLQKIHRHHWILEQRP